MIRLVSNFDDTIKVYDMADGDVGVITYWCGNHVYIGTVVQRYGGILIVLGAESGAAWKQVLDKPRDDCRVRLLKDGEQLAFSKK